MATAHDVVAGATIQRVVAITAEQAVIACHALEVIAAGTPAHDIAEFIAGYRDRVVVVIAVRTNRPGRIDFGVLDIVGERIGEGCVPVDTQGNRIVAGARAFDHHVQRIVEYVNVVAGTARQAVVAGATIEGVIATGTAHGVIAAAPVHPVRSRGTVDRVGLDEQRFRIERDTVTVVGRIQYAGDGEGRGTIGKARKICQRAGRRIDLDADALDIAADGILAIAAVGKLVRNKRRIQRDLAEGIFQYHGARVAAGHDQPVEYLGEVTDAGKDGDAILIGDGGHVLVSDRRGICWLLFVAHANVCRSKYVVNRRPAGCMSVQCHPNTAPPLTPSTCPVIHWASSEHRNATIEAISAGSPRRQLRAPFSANC